MIKMDLLERFKTILNKKYLSHIHTTYSDGENSVEEYCAWAHNNTYDSIVFSEHVIRQLSYDFNSYIKDIEHTRQLFPSMEIWSGIEAKVLPDGILDIPEDILSLIDVLFFACHTFSGDANMYKTAFSKVFQDRKWKNHIRIWAHPGLFFKTRDYRNFSGILIELIDLARREDILIEKNIRYNVPSDDILSKLDQSQIIIGHDVHSIESLNGI